jgi:beta-glucosidase
MNEPERILVALYRWKNTPLYPFGHGLSYSKFEYSNLQLSSNSFAKSGKIEVSVYKKYRKCCGKEVVQLYIRDLIGSVTRPVKELKGFWNGLQPNETKKVVLQSMKKPLSTLLPIENGRPNQEILKYL